MTLTCQRCGKRASQTIATQFHAGWCIDCLNDLIAAEQEAVQHLIDTANDEYLASLLPKEQ